MVTQLQTLPYATFLNCPDKLLILNTVCASSYGLMFYLPSLFGIFPSGDLVGDLCSGLPGVCGVPGGLQGLPVRAAMP